MATFENIPKKKTKKEPVADKQGESMKSFLERQYDTRVDPITEEEKRVNEFVKKYYGEDKLKAVQKALKGAKKEKTIKTPRKRVTKKEAFPASDAEAEVSDKKPEPTPVVSDSEKVNIPIVKSMEDVERDRAQKAQDIINNTKFSEETNDVITNTATDKEPVIKTMEEVEKERAQKAQEEIRKIKFEEDTNDVKLTKKPENGSENFPVPVSDAERIYDPDEVISPQDLENIKNELDIARKEYLEIDYKKNTGYKRVGRILGRFWTRSKEENLLENDTDIAWYRAHYDNKLFEYKNALLENAKSRGVSNEELGNILKIFETEAKINLADGHTQVKIEDHEGKLREVAKNQCLKIIEEYKKLPLKTKIAIGAGFGLVAIGAGLTGSAIAVGTAGAAVAMRRAFMGAVTGTTVAMGMESLTKKRTEKRVGKEVKKATTALEGLSEAEKTALIEEKINKLILDENNQIDTIKNKNLRNLATGIAAGTLIGSGAMSYVYKLGVGGFSAVKGLFGGSVAEHVVSSHEPGSAAGKVEIPGNKVPVPPVQETPSGSNAAIPEKSSAIPPEITKPKIIMPMDKEDALKDAQGRAWSEKLNKSVSGKGTQEMYGSLKIDKSAPLGSADNPYTPENMPSDSESLKSAAEGKASVSPQETSAEKVTATSEGKKLIVEKSGRGRLGGSVEGIIKKSFIGDGIDRTEAGRDAHLMRLRFDKFIDQLKAEGKVPKGFSLHVVQPEAQVELSADGKDIIGFKDGPGGKFTGHIRIENGKAIIIGQENPGGGAMDHSQETSRGGTKIPEENRGKVGPFQKDGGLSADQSIGPKKVSPENWIPRGEDPAEILGRLNGRFVSEVKKMSLGNIDNWNQIKDRKVEDVISWLKKDSQLEHTKLAKKIREVLVSYKDELGTKGNPEKDEIVWKWLKRVIKEREKLMLESKKYSIAV